MTSSRSIQLRFQAGQMQPKATHALPRPRWASRRRLIESQTLVAEAIIHQDRRRFLQGFYAYPMCRESRVVDALYHDMVALNRSDLPAWID